MQPKIITVGNKEPSTRHIFKPALLAVVLAGVAAFGTYQTHSQQDLNQPQQSVEVASQAKQAVQINFNTLESLKARRTSEVAPVLAEDPSIKNKTFFGMTRG